MESQSVAKLTELHHSNVVAVDRMGRVMFMLIVIFDGLELTVLCEYDHMRFLIFGVESMCSYACATCTSEVDCAV